MTIWPVLLSRRQMVLAFASIPFAAEAQTTGTAHSFVESIYKPYLDRNFNGHPFAQQAGRFFTPALAEANARDSDAAARKHQVPNLDGDPFIDAQAFDIHDLKIALDGNDKAATATVSFTNSGKPQRIVLALLLTPAGWRIDDIHGPMLSLRELYKLK